MSIGWQKLPDIIFGDIMTMKGLSCLEEVHRCRQVCQSWNVMIMQMTKHKKDNIRTKAESLTDKVMTAFSNGVLALDLRRTPEIVNVAILSHHGLLGSWKTVKMYLHDVDLASVSAKHIRALASCATMSLSIENVRNIDMTIFLASMKCPPWSLGLAMTIAAQNLGSEETRALVRAMETNVKMLHIEDKVILDIAELTQYSGQGACYYVSCRDKTAEAYEQLRTWALRNNWFVFGDNTASTFIRQAVVAAAMPQQAGQEPLTATMLAAAPPQEQKQMLGERLFPLIQRMYPDLAGKITGMLLEIDNAELLHMLEDGNSLKSKVRENDFLDMSRL